MSEETNVEIIKPSRGRPKKTEVKVNVLEEPESNDCPACAGTGQVEVIDEDHGESLETCEFCEGSGKKPAVLFEPDDVTNEDIEAIEKAIGYTARAWGFIPPDRIIAAAASRMGRKPVPA